MAATPDDFSSKFSDTVVRSRALRMQSQILRERAQTLKLQSAQVRIDSEQVRFLVLFELSQGVSVPTLPQSG